MADLPEHTGDHRALLVLSGAPDLPQAKRPQRAAGATAIASAQSRTCADCGATFAQSTGFCPRCGKVFGGGTTSPSRPATTRPGESVTKAVQLYNEGKVEEAIAAGEPMEGGDAPPTSLPMTVAGSEPPPALPRFEPLQDLDLADAPRTFALTPAADLLRSGAPGGARDSGSRR